MKSWTLVLMALVSMFLCWPAAVAAQQTFPLVAGAGNGEGIEVGQVVVSKDSDCNLTVEFVIFEDMAVLGWYLTSTHLHVAANPEDFPTTKKGSPKIGQFDYQHDPAEAYSDVFDSIVCDQACPPDPCYIAAHAVVACDSLLAFEFALPGQVTIEVKHPGTGFGIDSYFDTEVSGETSLDGMYDGWCVDTGRVIQSGREYTANVYSSYDEEAVAAVLSQEAADAMPKVNYLINNYQPGDVLVPGYLGPLGDPLTYGDIQRAIWVLIGDPPTSGADPSDPARVGYLVDQADYYGPGFEPGCGDQIAVILEPVDDDGTAGQVTIAQVTMIQVGIDCFEYCEETAWGNVGSGIPFPGRNWATYFEYTPEGCQCP